MAKNKTKMTKEQLENIRSELAFLNAQQEILDQAKQAIDRAKSRLESVALDIMTQNEGSEVVPGVQIKSTPKAVYDAKLAFEFCTKRFELWSTTLKPDNLDIVATLVKESGAKPEHVYKLDTVKFQTALRKGGLGDDAPPYHLEDNRQIAINWNAVRMDSALDDAVEVIE